MKVGPPILCALCRQPVLGVAQADDVRLCHHESRDCFRDWTVYGLRPCLKERCVSEAHSVTADPLDAMGNPQTWDDHVFHAEPIGGDL